VRRHGIDLGQLRAPELAGVQVAEVTPS